MTDPMTFQDDHMTRLGLTLDFSPADLAANRAGELGPTQLARLENDLRWTYWPVIVGMALLAFVLGGASASNGEFAAFPVFFFMGLAVIPAVLLHLERQKLPDQPVQRTLLRMGSFSLFARRLDLMDDQGPAGRVTLRVEGGHKVFARRHLYKVLNANRSYIVYFAPVRTWSGYRALSIEPAGDNGADYAPNPKRKGKRG